VRSNPSFERTCAKSRAGRSTQTFEGSTSHLDPVTARKDDAPAAYQAAITNLAGLASFSGGGALIQTTFG